ncbi:MAG: phosphatidylserine decarboxylase family protein [Phycisphaerales bacterium]|nr:phosphatidylserine decarboxylase family protein [Phycisphaerales bacterium]
MLTKYGMNQWLTTAVVVYPIIGACIWLADNGEPAWWIPAGFLLMIWLCFAAFFRDPPRRPTSNNLADFLSPADGTVSAIVRVAHHEATNGPALVIRIFLSVLNVHINRSAQNGIVIRLRHQPGRYLDARASAGARVNENLLLTLQLDDGRTYGIRQISGAIARRIVCRANLGDRLLRGQRFGMIQFGSTTELILPQPEEAVRLVREGMRVYAGRTSLARLNPIDSSK